MDTKTLLALWVALPLSFAATARVARAQSEGPASSVSTGADSDAGRWRPQVSLLLGGEFGDAGRELNVQPGRQAMNGSRAVGLQLSADVLHFDAVAGVFGSAMLGGPANVLTAGLRGGYHFGSSNLKLLGELGLHDYVDVGDGLFSSSTAPSVMLAFVGARLEWAPRAHRFFSPLFALGVRQDLGHSEVSGNYSPFFGPIEMRTYRLGGPSVGLQLGASFDFYELVQS